MKNLIKWGEAVGAWFLIYIGLWVATGNWIWELEDKWRAVCLIVILIVTRASGYEMGRLQGRNEGRR